MKQQFIHFLRFIVLSVIILWILDFSLGAALQHLYNRMTVGEKARANYFIKKDTSDVIIFGSSHALYHYNSAIIAESLKTSVYNAGRSNQSILYHLALLKGILKRHTPTIAILDLREDELVQNKHKYEVLSALLPYCKDDNEISEVFLRVNPRYKYWSWSNILPYNSSLFAILYRGLKKGKDKDIKGYMPLEGALKKGQRKTIISCGKTEFIIDPMLTNAFIEFISLCKLNHIKLFVFVSPRYTKYNCQRQELKSIQYTAKQNGAHIYNFSEIMDDERNFHDEGHLNSTGASVYSRIVSDSLKVQLAKTAIEFQTHLR